MQATRGLAVGDRGDARAVGVLEPGVDDLGVAVLGARSSSVGGLVESSWIVRPKLSSL